MQEVQDEAPVSRKVLDFLHDILVSELRFSICLSLIRERVGIGIADAQPAGEIRSESSG